MEGQWLQASFSWDPASLEARPAKAAGVRKAGTAPVCQVEGCGLDLSSLRFFFRKQRICEHHARADVVTDSAGRQLRFCQQCTRLEPIHNFNANRRSCKTSLAKRQARAHRGKAHSSPDSSPERGRAAPPHRRGASSSEGEADGGGSLKGSSRRSGGSALPSKRSRGSPAGSGGASPGGPAIASNGSSGLAFTPHHSAQPAAQLPGVQQQGQGQGQGQGQEPEEMLWSGSLFESDIEELLALDPEALADALLVPPCTAAPNNHRQAGSSGSATHVPPMPFRAASPPGVLQQQSAGPGWGADAGGLGAAPVVSLPAYTAAPAPFAAMPGVQPAAAAALWPGMPALAGGPAASSAPTAQPVPQGNVLAAAAPAREAQWGGQPEALQVAAMQQATSGVQAAVQQTYPLHVITRFSLKIFGVNPDHLPPQLRAELLAALQVSPTVLEGAIRCGCTHVVVDALLSEEERRQLCTAPRLAAAVQHMRRVDCWRGRPVPPAIVAQLGQLVALGTASGPPGGGGEVPLPCIHLGTSQLLPRLALAGPIATTVGAAAGTFRLAAAPAGATGRSPAGLAAALRCRCHGRHVGLAVSALRPAGAADSDLEPEEGEGEGEGLPPPLACAPAGLEPGATVLEAWAPGAGGTDGTGLYEFELSAGSLLSDSVPVLVLPDSQADAAAELRQLQGWQAGQAGEEAAWPATIVRLVAAVLRFLEQRSAAAAAGPDTARDASFRAAYPPPAVARLAAVAQRLAATAVRARWPALLRLLLPAVAADGAGAEAAICQLDALAAPAPSLLHLATASGAAATLAALRGWAAGEGAAWHAAAAAARSPHPNPSPLMVAAAMGPALDQQMAEEASELVGRERLAAAADAAGLASWTPRQVAVATSNAALLAALPPTPQRQPVAAPARGAVPPPEAEAAASEQLLRHRSRKLLALEGECGGGYEPLFCGGGKGERVASPPLSKLPAGDGLGRKGGAPQAPPSRDATLLAGLLNEMHVPPEPGCGGPGPAAAAPPRPRTAASQLLATSVAGAAAAVVAALASVAVRMAS